MSHDLSRLLLFSLFFLPLWAQNVNEHILPPHLPWDGAGLKLVVADDHPWVTPFELSGLTESPSYEKTMAWFERLAEASPWVKLLSLGTSWQGRAIRMVVVSKDRAFTPAALKATGKPLFLAHAGIHAGEIDGKDAGMMLLRDLTVAGTKSELLDKVNLLFIPILSVDGHERSSAFNRINQRGPRLMGWRTNARNLNLNRDFTKIETPELHALLRVFNDWQPDLYFDIHVTDGIDYQYDITYGFTGDQGHSPAASAWMRTVLSPALNSALKARGHVPGPLIFAVNNRDLSQGIVDWTAGPRFSNGYGNLRHLPAVLVENHSLKPYKQRVLGTYVLLEAALRVLGENGATLDRAVAADRQRRPERVTLSWMVNDPPHEKIEFLGIAHETLTSQITGSEYVRWLGKPQTFQVPYVRIHKVAKSVLRPAGYWVPPTWPEIIEKLRAHGVQMTTLQQAKELDVEMYRLTETKLAEKPFEGRIMVTAKPVLEHRKELFPAGSVWISTDQPLCELIVHLLEPDAPDSFFQWGYFHEVLQATEYFETYALIPLAERMLAENPALKQEFEAQLKVDLKLATNPRKRLDWFYQRSDYADKRWLLYPIARGNGP